MSTIGYIDDQNGNHVFPVTHERAVRDSDGVTLETKLGQKQNTIQDLSTIRSGAAAGATAVQPAALDAKQDVIADLPTIRSGAALGSTSVQPVDIEDMVEAEPIGSIIPPVNQSENTVQLTKNGQLVFPVTDVSLVMGLQDAIKLPPVKVATLPTASADTAGKMYYVGPDENDEYERYITSAVNGSYDWIDLGNTAIPLPSIADNLVTDDANTALSAKQGKVLDGKISQLGQEVDGGNDERTPETERGYYFASSGNNLVVVESSGSYHTGTIVNTSTPPTNGEDISMYIGKTLRITASNVATSSSRLAVIVDENYMILSRASENQYTQGLDGNYTYDLDIPSGAKWFFWSGVRLLVKIEILDAFVGLDERVQNLEGNISSESPEFVKAVTSLAGADVAQTSIVASRYISVSDGTLGISSQFDVRFINVRNAKKIYVKTEGLNALVAIAFYGKEGITDTISIHPLRNGVVEFCLDVPSNAFMLGVSCTKTYNAIIQIAQGSTTPIVCATDVMEIGDININGSDSSYSYRYLTTRARTIYHTSIHLNAGDKVFTDGSVVLYYAANTDSGFIYGGWVTEIPVYNSGDYVFVARFATEAAPADGNKKYITEHIFIQSDNAYQIIEDGKRLLSPHNNWDRIIKSINHRGYSVMAPENTLPAFRLSKEMGFGFIETDIFFTADNEIVCIHDATVDRTSNGTGNVTDMTLAELKALDFGSWFSPTYAGTKIPTLKETLSLCHDLGIGCYIELKTQLSSTQAAQVYNLVKSCGMVGKISYISFALQPLQAMANIDKSARLGWLGAVTQENIDNMLALITDNQKVFMDSSDSSDGAVALCVDNDIEQEWWITEQEPAVASLPKAITGLTSNHLVAGRLLYLAAINH